MKKNKLVLFTLKPHSVIDVITNSSSELFVGTSQSKEKMQELIETVYPNFRNEYEELKNIDDLTPDELDTFFSYACSPHMWPASKFMYPVLPGFTFEELYEVDDDGKRAWNGELQYRLKNNDYDPENKWHSSFVTENNFEEIKNKLDPRREMFFLFSTDENPDYEKQEVLESFMDRYHLG